MAGAPVPLEGHQELRRRALRVACLLCPMRTWRALALRSFLRVKRAALEEQPQLRVLEELCPIRQRAFTYLAVRVVALSARQATAQTVARCLGQRQLCRFFHLERQALAVREQAALEPMACTPLPTRCARFSTASAALAVPGRRLTQPRAAALAGRPDMAPVVVVVGLA